MARLLQSFPPMPLDPMTAPSNQQMRASDVEKEATRRLPFCRQLVACVLHSPQFHCSVEVISICALLTVQSTTGQCVFKDDVKLPGRPESRFRKMQFASSAGDLLTLLQAYEQWCATGLLARASQNTGSRLAYSSNSRSAGSPCSSSSPLPLLSSALPPHHSCTSYPCFSCRRQTTPSASACSVSPTMHSSLSSPPADSNFFPFPSSSPAFASSPSASSLTSCPASSISSSSDNQCASTRPSSLSSAFSQVSHTQVSQPPSVALNLSTPPLPHPSVTQPTSHHTFNSAPSATCPHCGRVVPAGADAQGGPNTQEQHCEGCRQDWCEANAINQQAMLTAHKLAEEALSVCAGLNIPLLSCTTSTGTAPSAFPSPSSSSSSPVSSSSSPPSFTRMVTTEKDRAQRVCRAFCYGFYDTLCCHVAGTSYKRIPSLERVRLDRASVLCELSCPPRWVCFVQIDRSLYIVNVFRVDPLCILVSFHHFVSNVSQVLL